MVSPALKDFLRQSIADKVRVKDDNAAKAGSIGAPGKDPGPKKAKRLRRKSARK